MKKIIYITLFLCFFIPLVSANIYWWQEANADMQYSGSSGYLAYSSMNNSLVTVNIDYEECSVTGSDYTPIATDINGDRVPDLHVVDKTNNRIDVYDLNCNFLARLTVPEDIRAMPITMNPDAQSMNSLFVLTNVSLLQYDWTRGIPVPYITRNISYKSLETDLDWFTCVRSPMWQCLGFKAGEDDVYVFNVTNASVSKKTGVLTNNLKSMLTNRTGVSNMRDISGNDAIIPMCFQFAAVGGTTMTCDILDVQGNVDTTFTNSVSGQALSSMDWVTAYPSRVNGVERIFIYGEGNSASGFRFAYMYTTAGLPYIEYEYTGANIFFSNWAIGDYDLDGDNDACIVNKSTSDHVLECFSATGVKTNETNISNLVTFGSGLILADFNSSENTLGIGTAGAIYYDNGTGNAKKFFDPTTTASNNGHFLITVQSSVVSASPSLIYSTSGLTTITRNLASIDSCGNSVCDSWENAFSCPSDCGVESDGCINNSQCPTNYPLCLVATGECVYISPPDPNATLNCDDASDCPTTSPLCIGGICAKNSCTQSSDCTFSAPFCYQGVCISGASSGISNINLTGDDASNVTSIQGRNTYFEGLVDTLIGSGSIFRFLIGIGFILMFIGWALTKTQNPIVIMFVALLGLIVNITLGLMPIYFLIVLIISMIGIWLFSRIVMGSSNGGG